MEKDTAILKLSTVIPINFKRGADQKNLPQSQNSSFESTIVWEWKESSNYNEKLDKNPIFNAFFG